MKLHTGLAAAAIALGAFAISAPSPAHAQMGKLKQEIEAKVKDPAAAEAIYKRRATMRHNAALLKQVGAYVKTGKGSPKEVAADAKKVAEILSVVPTLFPAGTGLDKYPGATGAKPAAWEKPAEVKKHAEDARMLAMNLEKVASAPGATQKTIGAALGNLGKNGCGGCHRVFREKLN